jgi:hypothetical protein
MIQVKQRAVYDCVLASLAMATGKDYDSMWPDEFRADIEAKHGTFGESLDRAYALAGLTAKVDLRSCYVGGLARGVVATILWGRRAMIQVPSLNHEGAQHVVYWDGAALHDPSNKQVYRWLDQVTACEYVWLFNEAAR